MSGTETGSSPGDPALGPTLEDPDGKAAKPAVPEWLGLRYRVTRVLGHGGMGAVYLAVDEALLCKVALKTIAPEKSSRGIGPLRDEVRMAQKVTHGNVCRTYDLEEVEGNWLIKMEYIAGQTLASRMEGRALPVAEVIRVAREVCAGLDAAHRQGVVHRDLKPDNIMVEAETDRVVLMDFGIARAAALAGKTAENVSGTPEYMAPEQVRGREVDGRADLYSLGCVLYEMLVGARVFPGMTGMAAALAHTNEPAPPLPRRFPDRLRRLVARLLEKDPARRPASAEAVAALLAGRPRRRAALIVALLACATLAALAGWFWRNADRARWARDVAVPEVERLLAAEELDQAAALASQALAIVPNDVVLNRLWIRATIEVSIESTPAGAEVLVRPYRSSPESWSRLGRTPLSHVRVPRNTYVWQVVAPGRLPVFEIFPFSPVASMLRDDLSFELPPLADVPPDMVSVPAGEVQAGISGNVAPIQLGGFLIDRHEVTNQAYQAFVDAGGYRRPELWKAPFVQAGRTLSWAEAMQLFRDGTGRQGPSTWELGHYPAGRGSHPVAGVSWFEAAAYAEYSGKSLPTVPHWYRAAQLEVAAYIVPGSNFDGAGTVPVGGVGALSGFGTTDMAGNVTEWGLNENQRSERYLLGGGFGDPSYLFFDAVPVSPWTRAPNVGFRCVKLNGPVLAAAAQPIDEQVRDFDGEKPASEQLFRAFESRVRQDGAPRSNRIE